MAKNVLDFRFGVRRADSFESSIWRAWATVAGDVYLAARSMVAVEKYSFHKSGICRRAFTRAPSSLPDRLWYRWRRDLAPASPSDTAIRVAWLAFPTDYLSQPVAHARLSPSKAITWIDAAPGGGATFVELGFIRESETRVASCFSAAQSRRLILYQPLPTGETFMIDYYHGDWENRDLRVPGNGKVRDLVFSASDPLNTGRPLRLTFGPNPVDGDAARVQELGGYPV